MQNILNWVSSNQEIIYIVILMIFLGIEVIGRVPAVLHTPLMSGANAIHGVVIIGAIIVMGKAESDDYLALALGFVAVVLGTLNVVGGFVVTDRMLEMFKKKKVQTPKGS
jgi:H+-translocating NAD(P) transhydrogenase subunit alpha